MTFVTCSYASQYAPAFFSIHRVKRTEIFRFARHFDMLGHSGPCAVGIVSVFISVRTDKITTAVR